MSVDIVEKRHAGQHTSVMSKHAGHSLGDERRRGDGDASRSPNAQVASVAPEHWGGSSTNFAGSFNRRFNANSGSRGNSGLTRSRSGMRGCDLPSTSVANRRPIDSLGPSHRPARKSSAPSHALFIRRTRRVRAPATSTRVAAWPRRDRSPSSPEESPSTPRTRGRSRRWRAPWHGSTG